MASLAVATVCFNAADTISDTLQSIRAQTRHPNEVLLIDGGSTDHTMEIAAEYSDILTECVSEPDLGIADAMNKAISACRSDYLMFLHADDVLAAPNVLSQVELYLGADDLICFPILFGSPERCAIRRSRGFLPALNLKTTFMHQGVFASTLFLRSMGGFDEGLKIAMDYDFFLRCYRVQAKARLIDSPVVARMADGGLGSRQDWPGLRARLREERRIHFRHSSGMLMDLCYWAWWAAYWPYKRIQAHFRGGFSDALR